MRPTKFISFSKLDILFFAFVFVTSLLIFAGWNTATNPLELIGIRFAITAIVLLLIATENKTDNKLIYFLRNVYPVVLSGYFYQETAFYNKLFFSNFDSLLEHLDFIFFGQQLSLTFSEAMPNLVFSELMYFSYFSFYLLIFFCLIVFYFQKKENFVKAVFYLAASLYLFYLLFAVFPSTGPQFYFTVPENLLPNAYLFDKIIHFVQEVGEQPTGAFPSSHVGLSIIILIISYKNAKLFFNIALPFTILITLATVYIKAHFLVDVIGGILFAPALYYFSRYLFRIIPEIKIKSSHNA